MLPLSIGNCRISVSGDLTCEKSGDGICFDIPGRGSIRIAVDASEELVLLNPRRLDDQSRLLMQEVVLLYTKELPAMSYAANTGKHSSFLERCVTNRKYCTLILRKHDQVVAAMTYQIVASNMCCAEIPLAAVQDCQQRKGLGTLLYADLSRRLYGIGVSKIYCWADEESEAFWRKQNFIKLGEIDRRGKPGKLRLDPKLRKAFSIPGSATLMVSNLNSVIGVTPRLGDAVANARFQPPSPVSLTQTPSAADVKRHAAAGIMTPPKEDPILAEDSFKRDHSNQIQHFVMSHNEVTENLPGTYSKKRHFSKTAIDGKARKSLCTTISDEPSPENNPLEVAPGNLSDNQNSRSHEQSPVILFMNMANEQRRRQLSKLVEKLGGKVTMDGSKCTHVLTGQIRRTMNFCSALCVGAWILSPDWLKASVKAQHFVDPDAFIVEDLEFRSVYNIDVAEVVKRAKTRSLFEGFRLYFTPHVEPNVAILSQLAILAGGLVVSTLQEVEMDNASKKLVITCETDTFEALTASKAGLQTFDTEWLLSSIMKQELDFSA